MASRWVKECDGLKIGDPNTRLVQHAVLEMARKDRRRDRQPVAGAYVRSLPQLRIHAFRSGARFGPTQATARLRRH